MIKKVLLGLFLVCVGVVIFGSGLLLFTKSGLRVCITVAEKVSPGTLTVGSVKGRLVDQFQLQDVSYIDDFGKISLDSLLFSWRPFSLTNKNIEIKNVQGTGVAITVNSQEEKQDPETGTSFTLPELSLPFAVTLHRASIESLTVVNDPGGQKLDVSSMTIEDLSGEKNLIRIKNGSLSSDFLRIDTGGQLQITDTLSTDLVINFRLDYRETVPLAGKITLQGTDQQLEYEASLQSPSPVIAKGSIYEVFGNLHWDAFVSAEELAVSSFDETLPEVIMADLQLSGEGDGSSYSLQVESKASYDSLTDITVLTKIGGDGSGLRFENILVNRQEMQIHGNGSLGWADGISWQAKLTGNEIDPFIFSPEWQGHFGFDAVLSGKVRGEQIQSDFDLQRLDGEVRGYPIHASGSINVNGENINVERFYARSADSVLNVHGYVGKAMGLEFDLNSSNLENIWPDLSGAFVVTGQVRGDRENPDVEISLTGDEIAYDRIRIGKLTGSGSGMLKQKGTVVAEVHAEGLVVGEQKFNTFVAELQGELQKHILRIQAKLPTVSASFEFEGGYSEKAWEGNVTKAGIQSENEGKWYLREPATLKLSNTAVNLKKFCLGDQGTAKICLDGDYSANTWTVKTLIKAFPVRYFEGMQSRLEDFTGLLSGTAFVQGKGASLEKGELDLAAENLSARFALADDLDQVFAWKSFSIQSMR